MLKKQCKNCNNRRLSGSDWGEIACYTLIPFALPFVFAIPDRFGILGMCGKHLVVFVGIVVEVYLSIRNQQQRSKARTSNYSAQASRQAFSKAYRLMEKKKGFIVNKSYNKAFSLPREMIPYDVHDYLGIICGEFCNAIAEMTQIRSESISVAFVYRYVYPNANDDDMQWKWIVGKESATSAPLDKYIDAEDTVFYTLVHGRKEANGQLYKPASVFANSKEDLEKKKQYHMSTRDRQHNKRGSVFGVKIVFGNNATSFVESILMVSSYGQLFVESAYADDRQAIDANDVELIIIEELFPFYKRLIESELGILYLRHIAPKSK